MNISFKIMKIVTRKLFSVQQLKKTVTGVLASRRRKMKMGDITLVFVRIYNFLISSL